MFSRPRISWSQLLVPLTLALIIVMAICSALYLREADQIAGTTLDNEGHRMERFTSLFRDDIVAAVKDLRLLSTGDGLQAYLATGRPADLDRAVHRAVFFSTENPDYDKIRYLDERGQEVIRINRNGEIVPRDQLQDKSDRPFFQKAQGLAPGQIFVSAFDLNIEQKAIEQPIKPMVRLSMPVFDAKGQRRGVYVINILGANIIDRLLQFVPQYQQRFRLLNAQGYWLKGAEPEEEWGFMLPGRSGMTLARTNPDLWAQIVREPEGQVPNAGGYFTWRREVPSESVKGKPVTLVADDDFLVFASQITPAEWAASFARLRQTFVVMAALLMVLATVITWFFYARRRVQQERDRFFNLTRDMLCIAGFDGHFKRVNPAWEKTLGYTSKEMVAKPFLDFVHPDDQEKTIRESARLAAGGEVISFENRYRCKDGSYRWLLWSARPLIEEQLIYASARDLTERKQIEEHVLKLNGELKQRADLLEVANKELESFSYSVSHDLRAPLRHIHGFIELLQKSPVLNGDESSRRYMSVISKAAKEMGRLIDDLLAFSRTGRAEMHPVKIDMREMIDQIIQDRVLECNGRRVTWEIKPLSTVAGDPSLLRLVWTNLLDNALKYTRPRPEAKIEIGQIAGDGNGSAERETVFYVRDNGVGFDMQYASKLFGVFQRLHRAEDFEGTGIGLANVQRIVHRHGGRVWAEGQVDSGATFYFSLPLTVFQPTESHG
jgi:PAS domain S-box-containing protein